MRSVRCIHASGNFFDFFVLNAKNEYASYVDYLHRRDLNLGTRLAVLRKLRGYTVEELAKRINQDLPARVRIGENTIRNLENGRKGDVTATELIQLARGLRVPVHLLLVDYSRPYELSFIQNFEDIGLRNIDVARMFNDDGENAIETFADAYSNSMELNRMIVQANLIRQIDVDTSKILERSSMLRDEYMWIAESISRDVRDPKPGWGNWWPSHKGEPRTDINDVLPLQRELLDGWCSEEVSKLTDAVRLMETRTRLVGRPRGRACLLNDRKEELGNALEWGRDCGLLRSRTDNQERTENVIKTYLGLASEDAFDPIAILKPLVVTVSPKDPFDMRGALTKYLIAAYIAACYGETPEGVSSIDYAFLNDRLQWIIRQFRLPFLGRDQIGNLRVIPTHFVDSDGHHPR